ncbi:hypothetical protein [Vasconcelosia minhoensis]|uniref:hypothetical protein n=1 Tax=Vasconcelosia minhoensis TaxID=3366354 RepID=UPI001D156E86|nr:hypothetical protein [Romeria gracilis]
MDALPSLCSSVDRVISRSRTAQPTLKFARFTLPSSHAITQEAAASNDASNSARDPVDAAAPLSTAAGSAPTFSGEPQSAEIWQKIQDGDLWMVNSRRRNGIIILREFHAEFAGPGAAVGSTLDDGCRAIIPIGNLSLVKPESHEAYQNALKIRLQWIRLTQNFTDQPRPADRAQMILEQFKTYFDQQTVDQVPNEAFALLVGVTPQTILRVRAKSGWRR